MRQVVHDRSRAVPHRRESVDASLGLPPKRRNIGNAERALKLLTRMLAPVNTHLDGREFLAGAFSGADIMTGHACTVAMHLGADVSDKPHLAACIERINARPAPKRAWAT